MQQSSPTTVLLAVLIIVVNGKAIIKYVFWLRFKIKTIFEQLTNDRKDKSNH